MISFLARVFRQFHMIVGVTAPPPGLNDTKFVLIWLTVIAVMVAWGGLVVYLMLHVF
jgi:hypothetical protein